PTIGIIGAGISSMLSFFALFIIRYIDTRKLMNVIVNWKKVLVSLGIIFIQIFLMFININLKSELGINLLLLMFLILNNHNIIRYLLKLIRILILKLRE